MRPLTVLFGFLLGTAVAATFSLTVIASISAFLSGSHPELAEELPRVATMLIGSICLTAAAAASFVGQLKLRAWRGYAHLATAAVLAAIVAWYARGG